MKNNKIWKLLSPIVVLVIICFVVTSLLAVSNQATAPVILEAQERAKEESMKKVLPEADGFILIEGLVGLPPLVQPEIYEATNGVGYVIIVDGKGYSGKLSVIVGLSDKGIVKGTRVLIQSETVGVGTQVVSNPSTYQSQLIGMTDTDSIQAISGATVSSNAMTAIMKDAFTAYEIIASTKEET